MTHPRPEVTDDWVESRIEVVSKLFERITFRPGTQLKWWGYTIEVCDDAVPDRDTGVAVPMVWDDNDLGERVHAVAADPTVSDTDLETFALRGAAQAIANNDVHEICEFFCVDGVRVFDPHPTGRRYDNAPVTVTLVADGDTITPARWLGGLEHVDVEDRLVARFAAEMAERVTIAGEHCFTADGPWLIHRGTYPDRVTGEATEFTWSTETLCGWTVPEGGNTAAYLRSACTIAFLDAAISSAVHEICEWLHVDGVRVYEPHPRTHMQVEQLRARLEMNIRPYIAAQAATTSQ